MGKGISCRFLREERVLPYTWQVDMLVLFAELGEALGVVSDLAKCSAAVAVCGCQKVLMVYMIP
jgi:hypothetical protein